MSNVGIKGEYQVMVLDAQGNVKEDTGWFSNLLLDNFFTSINQSESNRWNTSTANKTLRVGTGTTPPATNQTTLVSVTASTTTKTSAILAAYTDGQGRLCQSWEDTFSFPLGSIVATISEVGWQKGTTANIVHSRALITDVNGNPTSITLTAQDQLVVKYRLTLVDIFKEGSGSITLNGNVYNWISRRSAAFSANWFSLISGNTTSNISLYYGNAVFGVHGVSATAGTNGSDISLAAMNIAAGTSGQIIWQVRLTIAQGNNANGIKIIEGIQSAFPVKFEFTPAIPKTNQQILNLDVGLTVSRL